MDAVLGPYEGQTTQRLLEQADDYLAFSTTLCFEEGIGDRILRHGEAALTAEERTVFAVRRIFGNLTNGGFQTAVFLNWRWMPSAMEGLEKIGAQRWAAALREILAALEVEPGTELETVNARLNDRKRLAKVDEIEENMPYEEDVPELLLDYIESRPTAFRLP